MNKMPGRLGSLLARDVMSPHVLVLNEKMTLKEASEHLKSHRHSGGPVVDAQGKLIGTFSLRDLTGLKKKPGQQTDELEFRQQDSGIISAAAMEQILTSPLAQEKVADRMTRNAPSVTENASLIDVARLMCRFHTHRIPVTSPLGNLTGIITTMDVLAALVHTADELSD